MRQFEHKITTEARLNTILGDDAAMRRGVLTPFRTTSFKIGWDDFGR